MGGKDGREKVTHEMLWSLRVWDAFRMGLAYRATGWETIQSRNSHEWSFKPTMSAGEAEWLQNAHGRSTVRLEMRSSSLGMNSQVESQLQQPQVILI